jgi:hypothetical protein
VKKLAIEGKAERGSDGKGDGASLKMYLKVSIYVATPLCISRRVSSNRLLYP